MTIDKIYFATGNKGKLRHAEKCLKPFGIEVIGIKMDFLEIQSDSYADIALFKAKQAFEKVQKPVAVLDAGLMIPKLNGYPGTDTKAFIEKVDLEPFLAMINNYQPEDRRAYFCHHLCYIDKDENPHHFTDEFHGILLEKPMINKSLENSWIDTKGENKGTLWSIFKPLGAETVLDFITDEEREQFEDTARPDGTVWKQFALAQK